GTRADCDAIQFAHERRQVFRNGGASGIGKFGSQSSRKRLHEFHRVERDSGQTAHLTVRTLPALIVKHFSLAPRALLPLNKGPARRGPPRPRGSTRGLPGDAAQGGRLISAECRCLTFASRLRVVCPTPDSTRVKFAFSLLGACSKCDWRAAFSRDDLSLSWCGLCDAQPTRPFRRTELQ